MSARQKIGFILLIVIMSGITWALEPPQEVKVYDTPNDEGRSITAEWKKSASDSGKAGVFKGYEIYRSERANEGFEKVGSALSGKTSFVDSDASIVEGKPYYYVSAVSEREKVNSNIAGPVKTKAQWFNRNRVNVLILTILVGTLILWYIERARRGEELFVRKIPGLDAIDEAVGRSTELGRPILFSFGLGEIKDVVTIAALSILRQVAVRCAEHGTELLVPNWDPIVMAAAQETVQQAYAEPGRPDLYKEGNINFLTSDQFGYAAGVDGIMLREKPGAIFLLGYFYAEALILAETGHSVGAIQIAGTTAITQLPFFIAACDYTLIGEEMFAASSYIKREPHMLGSLKGEDFIKAILLILLILATLTGTLGFILEKKFSLPKINAIFNLVRDWFSNA